jgi:soluble lytic murein transglycosylase-like protein
MLAATVAPAGSQEGGRAPRLAGVRVDSARAAQRPPERTFSREFWGWLRDEARRFRELNGGPFAFAVRYRIDNDLAREIHQAAQDEGIDPDLAFRLVRVESAFNPRARSRVGALGLTQLMPSTARIFDRTLTHEAILTPRTNLRVGFRYLRGLINKYDGDLQLALLAYNRGDGAVDRDLRRGRNPENGYSRHVLGVGFDRYSGKGLLSAR